MPDLHLTISGRVLEVILIIASGLVVASLAARIASPVEAISTAIAWIGALSGLFALAFRHRS